MKLGRKKEEAIIQFIKNLRNLPNVRKTTKETDRHKGVIMFENQDFQDLFP